ncbi:MAG: HAD-IB family hydrolase [Microthrixaceae bacterium]
MATDAQRKVAAFDFDGTLTYRDTLVPFMGSAAGWTRLGTASLRVGLDSLRRKVDGANRDAVKAEMLRRLFTGTEATEIRRRGGDYAKQILGSSKKINPAVLARLREHIEAGHDVVFVSASLVYYLTPIAEELGIHHVIAVELSSAEGYLTGSLSHPNVRAEQKAIRLREWLGEPAEGPLTSTELWAYGNSSGDHELLAMADHAYWLGKSAKIPQGSVLFDPDQRLT